MSKAWSSSIRPMPEAGEHVGGYSVVGEIGRGTTSLILEVSAGSDDPLAMKLLSGEIKANDTVVVRGDLEHGQMVFAPQHAAAVNG